MSFDDLAEWINAAYERADSERLEIGRKLLQARAGFMNTLGFRNWCDESIKRSYRDIQKCMRLARAPDPVAAVEAERKPSRERMQRKRKAEAANVRHPPAVRAKPPSDLPRSDPRAAFEEELDATLESVKPDGSYDDQLPGPRYRLALVRKRPGLVEIFEVPPDWQLDETTMLNLADDIAEEKERAAKSGPKFLKAVK